MKVTIRFDGGCRPTNPGNKYGSFEVCVNGRQAIMVSKVEFGWGTNNEAEFDALEAGLKSAVDGLTESGNNPKLFDLEVFSDSTIVVNRINGTNKKSKSEAQKRMALHADRCKLKTGLFLTCKAFWNGRIHNVRKFGH